MFLLKYIVVILTYIMLYKKLMAIHAINNIVLITMIFNKIILFAENEQHGRMCSVFQQRYRKCVGLYIL